MHVKHGTRAVLMALAGALVLASSTSAARINGTPKNDVLRGTAKAGLPPPSHRSTMPHHREPVSMPTPSAQTPRHTRRSARGGEM